jgi:hypothetical protein
VCVGVEGGPHRGRPGERAGHGRGRAGAGHARARAAALHATHACPRVCGCPRRRAVGGGTPLGRQEPQPHAGIVDRLPPSERQRERAVFPLWPAGVQRGRARGVKNPKF